MSAVETLREAAKVLRERAGAAIPGPWETRSGSLIARSSSSPRLMWPPHATADAQMWEGQREQQAADATYIATMHPGVALALAGWLDKAADGDGLMPHRFPEGAPSEVVSWACGECATVIREAYGPTTTCPVDWRPRDPHALRVAEAILGGADRG